MMPCICCVIIAVISSALQASIIISLTIQYTSIHDLNPIHNGGAIQNKDLQCNDMGSPVLFTDMWSCVHAICEQVEKGAPVTSVNLVYPIKCDAKVILNDMHMLFSLALGFVSAAILLHMMLLISSLIMSYMDVLNKFLYIVLKLALTTSFILTIVQIGIINDGSTAIMIPTLIVYTCMSATFVMFDVVTYFNLSPITSVYVDIIPLTTT